ncbi:MAG: helix-turn-helix domain-containing protein [Actinomycetota bacterium]|nr:helix-turn-helix domain-containing protein [Actinomycetota bacterium]
MGRRGRRKTQPTDDWQELLPLFEWPEQEAYEVLRPLVLFGGSVTERARETGIPERTLYRRAERFEEDGMQSLFGTDLAAARAKRRGLEPAIRRMVVDLKAEHPALNNNEISNIVYVRTGRRLGDHTATRVLSEEVVPLKLSRLFEPYHEIEDSEERRGAVVALHLDGWSVKALASYLRVSRKTVYRVLERWLEEGEDGLRDRPPGRPKGVRKVDLATMDAIRRMQENPELGAFRIHAALEQKRAVEVSARTVGRIMAVHRNLYGLEKPKRGPHRKKRMPFEATRRHQIWTADVRYIKRHRLAVEGYLYVISILENYSRTILASAVCRRQNLASFLPVLYSAIERYGSPEKFVTDSGSVFLASRAQEIYEALAIEKAEIEKGKPWQSFIETTFNIQRRMADHHFARARSWQELVDVHGQWMEDYNAQRHWAHEHREDGRRSPQAVLGFYTGVRYHPEDLRRAFFETHFPRVLDSLGYARLMHWRILGHEGLAKRDVALWLSSDALTLEHAGEALSRYEVEYRPESAGAAGELRSVRCLELFETARSLPQPRLFGLEETLGDGWLKALKLDGYAPRKTGRPQALQEALFPYLEALG